MWRGLAAAHTHCSLLRSSLLPSSTTRCWCRLPLQQVQQHSVPTALRLLHRAPSHGRAALPRPVPPLPPLAVLARARSGTGSSPSVVAAPLPSTTSRGCAVAAAMPPPRPAADPAALFDPARFAATLTVPAVRVPARACQALVAGLRGHLFDMARVPAVVVDKKEEGGGGGGGRPPPTRLLLLRPAWWDTAAAAASASEGPLPAPEAIAAAGTAPPPDAAAIVAALPATARALLEGEGAAPTTATVSLSYDHFSCAAALRALLPPTVEVPTSFETVGHIAHLNLSPAQMEHAPTIGRVFLDKNPGLRTVVTKTGELGASIFRALPLRVIAGDPDTLATVTQAGCRFTLDYGRVYWNSRLEAEHKRCVGALPAKATVLDVMAGVGPFAIPAAKSRGCTIYANDLNPASFSALRANIAANRVTHAVAPFCVDGRAFIRAAGGVEALPDAAAAASTAPLVPAPKPKLVGKDGKPLPPPPPPLAAAIPAGGLVFAAAIMNLPATAVEFLDAFRGAFAGDAWAATRAGTPGSPPLPTIHVYAFAAADELEEAEEDGASGGPGGEAANKKRVGGGGGGLLAAPTVAARIAAALWAGVEGDAGSAPPAPPPGLAVRLVRDVAPNKRMVRATFVLPREVAFYGLAEGGGGAGKEVEEDGSPGGKRARVEE